MSAASAVCYLPQLNDYNLRGGGGGGVLGLITSPSLSKEKSGKIGGCSFKKEHLTWGMFKVYSGDIIGI